MTTIEKKKSFILKAESWLLEQGLELTEYYDGSENYPDIELSMDIILFLEALNSPYENRTEKNMLLQMEYYDEMITSQKFPVINLSGEETPFLTEKALPVPAGGNPYTDFLTRDFEGNIVWATPESIQLAASKLVNGRYRIEVRINPATGTQEWMQTTDGGSVWLSLGSKTAGNTENPFKDDTTSNEYGWTSQKISKELGDKVTAVEGKGLSTKDFTAGLQELLTSIKDSGTADQVWTPEGYKAISEIITIAQGPAFCKEYATYTQLTVDNTPKPFSQLAIVIDATADPRIDDAATVKWALYFWDAYSKVYTLFVIGNNVGKGGGLATVGFKDISGLPSENPSLKAALDAKLGRTETEIFTPGEKSKLGLITTTGTGSLVLCDDGLYRSFGTLGNGNPLNVDQEVKTYTELQAVSTTGMPVGWKIFCWDATDDPNIVSGWAMYEWNGSAYVILLKGDSLNVNLTDYFTKTEVNNLLAQKVTVETGKSLVADTEIAKLLTVAKDAAANRLQASITEAEAGTDTTKDMSPAAVLASIIKNGVASLFTTDDLATGNFWGAQQMEIQAALLRLKAKIESISTGSGSGNGESFIKSYSIPAHGYTNTIFKKPFNWNFVPATADTEDNSEFIGFPFEISDANNIRFTTAGAIDITGWGLVRGTYFLSPTVPGELITQAQVDLLTEGIIKPVLNVISDTTAEVLKISGYEISGLIQGSSTVTVGENAILAGVFDYSKADIVWVDTTAGDVTVTDFTKLGVGDVRVIVTGANKLIFSSTKIINKVGSDPGGAKRVVYVSCDSAEPGSESIDVNWVGAGGGSSSVVTANAAQITAGVFDFSVADIVTVDTTAGAITVTDFSYLGLGTVRVLVKGANALTFNSTKITKSIGTDPGGSERVVYISCDNAGAGVENIKIDWVGADETTLSDNTNYFTI